LAALRVICISLAVICAFVGITWLTAAVWGLLVEGGIRGWRDALFHLGTALLLLSLSTILFVLRFKVFAPRGRFVRAAEVTAFPLVVCTFLGGLSGAGIGAALVLLWDVPDWVGLPVTVVFIALGFVVGAARLKPPRFDHTRCVECGYDLRGSPGPRCSECGTPFVGEGVETDDEKLGRAD
jgi:hypothetical protein